MAKICIFQKYFCKNVIVETDMHGILSLHIIFEHFLDNVNMDFFV